MAEGTRKEPKLVVWEVGENNLKARDRPVGTHLSNYIGAFDSPKLLLGMRRTLYWMPVSNLNHLRIVTCVDISAHESFFSLTSQKRQPVRWSGPHSCGQNTMARTPGSFWGWHFWSIFTLQLYDVCKENNEMQQVCTSRCWPSPLRSAAVLSPEFHYTVAAIASKSTFYFACRI